MDRDKIKLGLKQQKTFMRKILTGEIPEKAIIQSCIDTCDDMLEDVITLLTALDEAEKLWDIKEWPVQTHIRSKTMAEHIEKIKCLFGDELSPWIRITPETMPEDKKITPYLTKREGLCPSVMNWNPEGHWFCAVGIFEGITHYQKITLPEK